MQELKTNEFGSYGLLNVSIHRRGRAHYGRCSERPIIFPLSNPSRLHEVHLHKANEWTGGRTLIATGSPFPPAKMPHGKDYVIAECNNVLIYPGLGLGAIVSRTCTLSDEMIIAGAQCLAAQHSPQHSKIQMTRSCQISPMRRK
ncbi:MAE1_3 [Sanghuangporus vaninii]